MTSPNNRGPRRWALTAAAVASAFLAGAGAVGAITTATAQTDQTTPAKYPGATIQRVETDSAGVYEAHLVTADGNRVTVELDANFNVTGEEAGPHR